MRVGRSFLLILSILLAACTMRSAINTMTSEQDRAFAQAMVDNLRRGNTDWLQQHFRPDLWQQSAKQMAGVPAMFPAETGTTEIVNFSTSTNMTNGRTERNREFTLVTHGGGRWTVTRFRIYSDGGRDQVVAWSVVPHSTAPEELTVIQAWDSIVPWIWAGLVILVAAVGGLIFWLVRRSRRRRDPLQGR